MCDSCALLWNGTLWFFVHLRHFLVDVPALLAESPFWQWERVVDECKDVQFLGNAKLCLLLSVPTCVAQRAVVPQHCPHDHVLAVRRARIADCWFVLEAMGWTTVVDASPVDDHQ